MGQGRVAINEIMFAPKAPEPEWIEILNAGVDTVDLSQWTISDPTKSVHLPSFDLGANQFIVITKDSTAFRSHYPALTSAVIQTSLPALNNSGDVITLHDSAGNLIDSVHYTPTWGTAGKSLERFDPLLPADSTNFFASIDPLGATPGSANSTRRRMVDVAASGVVFRSYDGSAANVQLVIRNRGYQEVNAVPYRLMRVDGIVPILEGQTQTIAPLADDSIIFQWQNPDLGLSDLLLITELSSDSLSVNDTLRAQLAIDIPPQALAINEIMSTPTTGFSQWLEVANTTTSRCNLERCAVAVSSASMTYTFTLHDATLTPTGFALITASTPIVDAALPNLGSTDTLYASTLHLRSDSAAVVLRNPDGSMIDSMWYDKSFISEHLAPSATGISLERRSKATGGLDKLNWASCVDPSGSTPLAENSVSTPILSTRLRVAASPNPFAPMSEGRGNHTTILIESGTSNEELITVRLYDERGRLVQTIVRAQRCVGNISIEYDGLDEHGARLPSGLYTLLATTAGGVSARFGIVIATAHK